MYGVIVEAGFSAVHRLRLADGTLEPLHGHDWRVRAHFTRAMLDDHGMVLDFDTAAAALKSVIASLDHADLNEHEGLSELNPTAEVVAKHVFDRLVATQIPAPARVEVTEAPGCMAWYAP